MSKCFYLSCSVLLLVFCNGCVAQNSKLKFPVEKQLHVQPLQKFGNINGQRIALYKDSVVFVDTDAELNKANGFFVPYSIPGKKMLSAVVPQGNEQGKTLGFVSFGIAEKNLWVYDFTKAAVIFFNIDSLLHAENYVAGTEYKLKSGNKKMYYQASIIDSGKIILNGNYDAGTKLTIVSLKTGDSIGGISAYDKNMSRFDKHARESALLLHPALDRCVQILWYSDEFEIINLKSGSTFVFKNAETFSPDLKKFTTHSGLEVAGPYEKTRQGYVSGAVTAKYMYFLFSGYNLNTTHKFYGNSICVYDWNGKPVAKYNLKSDMSSIAVSSDDKTIYMYDKANNELLKADIQL